MDLKAERQQRDHEEMLKKKVWSHLFNSISMHCIEGDKGKKDP